jgi:urease accessory protein UreF
MTKKMTRKEALQTAIEIMTEYLHVSFGEDDFNSTHTEQAISTLQNMIEQIDKQAARPKTKSTARIENERMAREFIPMLRELGKPVSAKWMTEHIRYCNSPQKAVQVAKIAEEWGAIKRITIKKRTYYEYDDTYRPLV